MSVSHQNNSLSSRSSGDGTVLEEHEPLFTEHDNTKYSDSILSALPQANLRKTRTIPLAIYIVLGISFIIAVNVVSGYTAVVLYALPNAANGTQMIKASFGKEYNKYIYPENELGERYCPDEDLAVRREWRKMGHVQKQQFVQAVQCLKAKPSKTRPSGSLFEDFAFIRGQIGRHTIGVASNFPWHRYVLWVFETELKNSCGYESGIPYWDWTLDFSALRDSPPLHGLPGFGGDGNSSVDEIGTQDAYCVTDGSFANYTAAYEYVDNFGISPSPHCVSRRFNPKDIDGHQVRMNISPQAIADIIVLPDFASFSEAMQNSTVGPAIVIPNWIRGDFAQYTAPNDALFFLHLAQVDRIWWLWQRQAPATRLHDYTGRRRNDMQDLATIHDNMSLGTRMAPDVEVKDVIGGQLGFMCFTYDSE